MTVTLFAAVALLAYATAIVLFIQLHIRGKNRVSTRHAVSDYGVGQTARLFVIYATAGTVGAAALAFATALSTAPDFPLRTTVYLAALVVVRIGLVLFPTDPDGSPRTRTGAIHLGFAIAVFALTYMVFASAQQSLVVLAGDLSWLVGPAITVLAISLGAVVVTMAPSLRRFFGLAERSFLALSLLGFLTVSAELLS